MFRFNGPSGPFLLVRALQRAAVAMSLILVVLAYVLPARFPPDVVAFKEALFSLGLLALMFSVVLHGSKLKLPKTPLLAVLVVGVLAAVWQGSLDASLVISRIQFLLIAILAVVLGRHMSAEEPRDRWLLPSAVVLGAVLLALFSVLSWHGLLNLEGDWQFFVPKDASGARAASGLGQSNNFGVLLVSAIWLLWYGIPHANRDPRWLLPMAFSFLCLWQGLFVSYSRTAVLGLVVSTLWVVGGRFAQREFRRGLWALIPLVGYVLVAWIYRDVFDGELRASSIRGFQSGDPQRWRMWSLAFDLISERPLSGWGAGQISASALDRSPNLGPVDYSILTHFHNTALDMLVEYGLLMGGAIIAVFVRLVFQGWRGSRQLKGGDALFAALIPVLIHALLEYPLSYGFLFWPLCFGLGYLGGGQNVTLFQLRRRWAFCVWLVMLVAWVGWYASYFRVESLYTKVRTGYAVSPGDIQAETRAFDRWAFAQYVHRLTWVVTPVQPDQPLTRSDMAALEKTARMYPTDLLVWKSAIANAAAGQPEQAAWWAERICRMYEPEVCDRAQSAWQAVAVPNWPILPWSRWRNP